MSAPGVCIDCGNEAYIRLAGERETMICAHCFAVRHPAEKVPTPIPKSASRVAAKREAAPVRRRAGE